MKVSGVPYQPRYAGDEVVLGIVAAVVLHVVLIGPFVLRAIFPKGREEEEKPLVARPVIQASLLKLGKPLDPKRLPDRIVPQQRTAPKKQIVASREDPPVGKKDAGAPPLPNTKDSDIQNLISKSDTFAEDAGKARPEEGRAEGVDGGQETDPNKVRAGEAYLAALDAFFSQRLSVPTVISVGEARKLCAVVQMKLKNDMVIWHVNQTPVIASGNELFDGAAISMMNKLRDDGTPLPTPPKELDEQFRKRAVQLVIKGDPHGSAQRCMPK
jgi:hypothetical protein